MKQTLAAYRAAKENTPTGMYSPAFWKEADAAERAAEQHYRQTGQRIINNQREALTRQLDELAATAENIYAAWGVLIDRARQGRIGAAAFRQAARALVAQRQAIPAEVERLREEAASLSGLDPIEVAERQYARFPALLHARPYLPEL